MNPKFYKGQLITNGTETRKILAVVAEIRFVSQALSGEVPKTDMEVHLIRTLHQLEKEGWTLFTQPSPTIPPPQAQENVGKQQIRTVGRDGKEVVLATFDGISPSSATLKSIMADWDASNPAPAVEPKPTRTMQPSPAMIETTARAKALYEEAQRVTNYFALEIQQNQSEPEIVASLARQRDEWVAGLHEQARHLNGLGDGVV